jgi:hypothetical protein
MLNMQDTFAYLEYFFKERLKLKQEREDILNSTFPQGLKDEKDVELNQRIKVTEARMLEILRGFATFPPHHDRYQKTLDEFHKIGEFQKSVFVMTKYPDIKNPKPADLELLNVIETVKKAISEAGYVPRLASDKEYYPNLWENVELHLLGCSKGVAIVESKYKPELNPNVAMEWGWMRGMGRRVLYLVEEAFDQKRADWGGLVEYSFAWADPPKTISMDVKQWLSNL